MPIDEAAVKRLVRMARHIDAETWEHGAQWYPREAAWIGDVAAATGHPARHAIAAFAALSPRIQYDRNRLALIDVANGRRPAGVFARSVKAAQAALVTGQKPQGPKTAAFDCNLAGCTQCVTVDVWAARAIGHNPPSTERQYRAAAAVYVAAARRLDVEPRTLQAAVWTHVRGHKPTDRRTT